MTSLIRASTYVVVVASMILLVAGCSNSVKQQADNVAPEKIIAKLTPHLSLERSSSSTLTAQQQSLTTMSQPQHTPMQISQQAWQQLEQLALQAEQDKQLTLVQKSSPAQQVTESVYGRLLSHFNEWEGTPYRLGGQNRNGVDCSAFVQIAYANKFSLHLPRTTELQRKRGKRIGIKQLQAGDVVFFKTGWFTYHNGIYLGDQQFMHASSSKGVILSSIEQAYWRERFIEARRLLN